MRKDVNLTNWNGQRPKTAKYQILTDGKCIVNLLTESQTLNLNEDNINLVGIYQVLSQKVPPFKQTPVHLDVPNECVTSADEGGHNP